MIELLAIPEWQTPPKTLDDWISALSAHGGAVVVTRESTSVSWVELGALRVRGYVVLEGSHVEAINFEVAEADPGPATRVIEEAARTLGWEIHPDDPDEESDDPDE